MKKISFLLFFFISTMSFSQKVKDQIILITCNQPDAAITINGKAAGKGSARVKLLSNSCTKIAAVKEGLYVSEVEFCNNGLSKIPKSFYLELEPDAAYEASVKTDVANVDINIKPKKSQTDSWKAVNSLVLQYIDAIETSDKENFYLKTAWVARTFNSGVVRTRIIVKTSGNEEFSIKIISEYARPGSSVKDDERFLPWDRVLRKYSDVIPEFQSRL